MQNFGVPYREAGANLERMARISSAGSAEHYAFALELYLSAMRPYTEELMVWDERRQRDSFAAQWKPDDVQIVALDGKCVGWLQVLETPTEIRLQQFFISPGHQRTGIGTDVLSSLVAIWTPAGKPFVLTVLKNNPARRLYKRFGFSVIGEAGVKFEMKRERSFVP
jgi:ribosomal protein S18 acetylase RimI-like enzyme